MCARVHTRRREAEKTVLLVQGQASWYSWRGSTIVGSELYPVLLEMVPRSLSHPHFDFIIVNGIGSSYTHTIPEYLPNIPNSLPGTRVWDMPVSPICWPSSSTRTTTPRCSSNTRITSACRPGMSAVVGGTGSYTCRRSLHSCSTVLAFSYEEDRPVAP